MKERRASNQMTLPHTYAQEVKQAARRHVIPAVQGVTVSHSRPYADTTPSSIAYAFTRIFPVLNSLLTGIAASEDVAGPEDENDASSEDEDDEGSPPPEQSDQLRFRTQAEIDADQELQNRYKKVETKRNSTRRPSVPGDNDANRIIKDGSYHYNQQGKIVRGVAKHIPWTGDRGQALLERAGLFGAPGNRAYYPTRRQIAEAMQRDTAAAGPGDDWFKQARNNEAKRLKAASDRYLKDKDPAAAALFKAERAKTRRDKQWDAYGTLRGFVTDGTWLADHDQRAENGDFLLGMPPQPIGRSAPPTPAPVPSMNPTVGNTTDLAAGKIQPRPIRTPGRSSSDSPTAPGRSTSPRKRQASPGPPPQRRPPKKSRPNPKDLPSDGEREVTSPVRDHFGPQPPRHDREPSSGWEHASDFSDQSKRPRPAPFDPEHPYGRDPRYIPPSDNTRRYPRRPPQQETDNEASDSDSDPVRAGGRRGRGQLPPNFVRGRGPGPDLGRGGAVGAGRGSGPPVHDFGRDRRGGRRVPQKRGHGKESKNGEKGENDKKPNAGKTAGGRGNDDFEGEKQDSPALNWAEVERDIIPGAFEEFAETRDETRDNEGEPERSDASGDLDEDDA